MGGFATFPSHIHSISSPPLPLLQPRRVPRLDGGKMGVFATRSPHRPCPIGLSVAQVLSVDGRTLVLGGADIVDGEAKIGLADSMVECSSAFSGWAHAGVVLGGAHLFDGEAKFGISRESKI